MPNLLDQQPLVPPVLRRFQAIKEQQALHAKHNCAVLNSRSDDRLASSESRGTKLSPRRYPKSTVHGVVDQFGQFHEQKSGIDRLLSSVGNIFRRMSTQEVRTCRVLDNGQNVDARADEKCLSLQENVSSLKGDSNFVDNIHTEKDDLPVVIITQFKESVPNEEIQNSASSQFNDNVKSCKGGITKSGDTTDLKWPGGSISNTNDETVPKSNNRETPKSRHRTQLKSSDSADSKLYQQSTSQSPEKAAATKFEQSSIRTRCTPDSDVRQPEVSYHNHKQWTNGADKLDICCEISENTNVRSSPEWNSLTELPTNPRHRKFNFSKIFRIKKNTGQKYSLPLHSSLGIESDLSQALLCDTEQDDNSMNCSDSKEVTAVESPQLPPVGQCPSGASNIANHSYNSLMRFPDRKGCPVKYLTNKIKELASRGAAASVPVGDIRGPSRRGTSGSNMAASPEVLRKFSSDLNLTKCERLADSTDELTQLIWAAF